MGRLQGRRMIALVGLMMMGSAGLAQVSERFDWSKVDLAREYQFRKDYLDEAAPSQAICRAALHAEPPAADYPTKAERQSLKGCDSAGLYFGLGMAADPVKARKCALMEREEGPHTPYGDYYSGSGILMLVYANGKGAQRNYDIAIHMACGIEDAPFAIEGRVEELAERKSGRGETGDLDICDHATSGVSSAYCADHRARVDEQARQARIDRLAQGWSPAGRAAFGKVYRSLAVYTDVAHDMDCFRGTAHAACAIHGANIDIEEFLRRIEVLASGQIPSDAREDAGFRGVSPAVSPPDLASMLPDDRDWYAANHAEAIAARRVFERDLLAFTAAAFPRFSRHRVRVMFRDI